MQFEYDPERLIEEVKKRKGIWDFEDADHRAKNVRHQLWTEIVNELLQSDVKITKSERRELEIQLQKKWKSIRDCFQKYIQKPNKTRRPYIYFKQLQFLLKSDTPAAQPNEGETSESDENSKQSKKWTFRKKLKLAKDAESSEDDNYNLDNEESRDYSNECAVEYEMPVQVAKITQPADEFAFANVDAHGSKTDNDDPDRLFLLSLLPHLKAVPEENRLNAKMDLMQVLRNASYSVCRDQKIF
ncbi:uncharacterized protein LOC135088358 [Ostrinia nubilalis]|uniref:uncharacterized protein LOC135088358 n=1 Tax=Ostrinia nubilalis TaxID=29057 RepID=UPI003082469D